MSDSTPPPNISLADLQALIRKMYFEKDQARGVEGTFLWLMEEVGELATALRSGTHQERLEEFADWYDPAQDFSTLTPQLQQDIAPDLKQLLNYLEGIAVAVPRSTTSRINEVARNAVR